MEFIPIPHPITDPILGSPNLTRGYGGRTQTVKQSCGSWGKPILTLNCLGGCWRNFYSGDEIAAQSDSTVQFPPLKYSRFVTDGDSWDSIGYMCSVVSDK